MNHEHFAITSQEESLKKIENFLFDDARVKFIPDLEAAKAVGLLPEKVGDDCGRLVRMFQLKHLRELLGLGEVGDSRILELLDLLCRERKLKVLSVDIPRTIHFNDLRFVAEVGVGLFGFRPPITMAGSHLLKRILYRDKPLTESEYLKGNPIMLPSRRAIYLRQQRDADFERRFGPKINMELQSKIRSEDRRSEETFKTAVLDLLEQIDKKLDKSKT